MIKFTILPGETEEEFVLRLREAWEARRDPDSLDYHPEVRGQADCMRIYNRECGYDWESTIPIRTKMGLFRGEKTMKEFDAEGFKMKVVENDNKRETRNKLRKEARKEALETEIMNQITKVFGQKLSFDRDVVKLNNGRSTIPVISDWHIGAEHDNYLGKFNLEIAKRRISEYAREIVKEQHINPAEEIIVLNTGDLIEGMIHVSTRVQQEFDVIEQTMVVSELIVQFLSYILENTDVPIRYGSVLDNHSRVHPNKKDSIEKESFGRIIRWYVESRFEEGQIDFIENKIDLNIGYIEAQGMKIGYVHGHLDQPNKVRDKLTNLIGTVINFVIISHRHHVATINGAFQSGTLKGVDEYALNFRATDAPSQMVIYVESGDVPSITRKDIYFK